MITTDSALAMIPLGPVPLARGGAQGLLLEADGEHEGHDDQRAADREPLHEQHGHVRVRPHERAAGGEGSPPGVGQGARDQHREQQLGEGLGVPSLRAPHASTTTTTKASVGRSPSENTRLAHHRQRRPLHDLLGTTRETLQVRLLDEPRQQHGSLGGQVLGAEPERGADGVPRRARPGTRRRSRRAATKTTGERAHGVTRRCPSSETNSARRRPTDVSTHTVAAAPRIWASEMPMLSVQLQLADAERRHQGHRADVEDDVPVQPGALPDRGAGQQADRPGRRDEQGGVRTRGGTEAHDHGHGEHGKRALVGGTQHSAHPCANRVGYGREPPRSLPWAGGRQHRK